MDGTALEQQLDAFNPAQRQAALLQLAKTPTSLPPAGMNVNMHFHSFFSYNAYGWSPSHIAWRACREGLYAAGLCDFDVLDGMDEFLNAGEILGLRTAVSLETRAFVPEYADKEISSPGEPGITYIMGAGFAHLPNPGTRQQDGLSALRQGARERNEALVERINAGLGDITVDYERDVMPLTPAGAATERHIVRAYINRAEALCGSPEQAIHRWAQILGKDEQQLAGIYGTPAMEEAVRSKLAKQGGIGYVQPSTDTFPPVQEFIQWVTGLQAVPMITWLDGTSEGEADAAALLEFMCGVGAAALNIIPDRNWNIADADQRVLKIGKLREIMAIAEAMELPVNIGTEMNKDGLPFTDDLSGPVLAEYRDTFLRGARIMVGHTILLRHANVSYMTYEATAKQKNELFAAIGALPPLSCPVAEKLQELENDQAAAIIFDAATRGTWPAT